MSNLEFDVIWRTWPYVLGGLQYTLQLTVVATVGGILFGTLLAMARLSANPVLAWIAAGYVNFMGGKLICSKETYEQFCAILRSNGATRVRGAARDSAARLYAKFGLKERYKIVEAKI